MNRINCCFKDNRDESEAVSRVGDLGKLSFAPGQSTSADARSEAGQHEGFGFNL